MEWLRETPRTTITAIGIAILVISLACGYWLTTGDSDKEYVGWIIVSVLGSLILAALMLRFVPATESDTHGNAPARRALVLGAAAVITGLVFWTGLPIVLGIPALVLAAEGRARAGTYGQGGEATAGAVLGGFAMIATVVLLVFAV